LHLSLGASRKICRLFAVQGADRMNTFVQKDGEATGREKLNTYFNAQSGRRIDRWEHKVGSTTKLRALGESLCETI
jgi:hypothetical protein